MEEEKDEVPLTINVADYTMSLAPHLLFIQEFCHTSILDTLKAVLPRSM
jgi:hypothetical protein